MNTIYAIATKHMGQHLTLNRNVPAEVGCAEAVSWILLNAGEPIPPGGIQTVNGLIAWMQENNYEETHARVAGAIITAHRPDPNDTEDAHVGVCLNFGDASNTSDGPNRGKFLENYRPAGVWEQSFGVKGSITRYFYKNI